MAKSMAEPTGGLGRNELEILQIYIVRARLTVKPRREELKAIVLLKRAIEQLQESDRSFNRSIISQPKTNAPPVMPQIYGNHQFIPDDWMPDPQTAEAVIELLRERGIDYDMDWLVQEFISYWKSRGQRMANWQQAFKHNVLQKIGRGFPCAPQAGSRYWPHTKTNRVFDRSAELREQKLNDFDREARDIVEKSRRPGGKAPGAVGKGD